MSDRAHLYRLLLIEDNPADMRLMTEGMRHAGLSEIATITPCYSAEECLRHLTDSLRDRRPYHLVLMDLNMPRTSGKELLRAIRADRRYARIPVYVYTNSDSPEDVQQCMDLGADMYIQKPADFGRQVELFESIRQSLVAHHRIESTAITGYHTAPRRARGH